MKAIAAPINRNSQSAEVTNLQEVLLLLLRRQLIQVSDEDRPFYEEGLLREQREQTYNDITQRVVGIFQEESRLQITGDVDEPTAVAFNRLLKALFVVRGNVRLMDNTPVPNVTVQAFDRDLRSRELLGQTTTNINGYYEIFYTRNQFIRAEKQTADLIVVAVEPILRGMVARSRTLAESATLFNAPRIAKVNLAIAANLFQPLSEYVRLIQTLGDLLVNVTIPGNDQPTLIDKLADLKEDDLDFLFHETNIELEKLQFLTQSARLQEQFSQQDFSVPLPAFYGLARTKGLNDLAGFARSSTEELRAGLIQAGGLPSQPQQNIIAPFESEDQLNQMVEIIHSVAINQVLTNPIGENQASLSQVLAIALPSVPHQQALLQTYANHDGTIEQFWDNLRQQETFQETGQVERIQFALQLNTLTQSNLSLVDALQTQFQSTRSLAQMNPAELTTLIKQLAPTVSPDFPGDTPEEKLNLYSNSIVGLLQGAFPTESIAQVVSTVADVHLNRVAPDQISQFLNRATDRAILATEEVFDIRSTQIDRFLELHGDRVFADIDGDRPQITQQVKRVQRLFQVSTSPESFKILMESGFNSANQIAQQSFRTMQENLGQQIPLEELGLIHQRAIATSAASLQTALLAYQSATDISPAAIGSGLKELPNWANLFGSLELCECQHCRSLYSPAAYFVDLLEFLRNAPPNAQGWTPLDVLVGNDDNPNRVFPGKRPDLPHIFLTCENTNTPIPYIDLVNEVLESYVAFGQLNPTTAKTKVKDTGLSTAPELSANPQYVEEGAYNRLRDAVFPTSLPFDRALEMARLYLDHLGSSRHEVLKAFEVDGNKLASEALGLSEKEFEILTGQDFQGATTISLSQLYTYANEDLTPRLAFDPNQIMANSAVVILQAKLRTDNPSLDLSLTGKYNEITQSAVLSFQQKFGLPSDGIVDGDDWAVLDSLRPNAVGAMITGVPEFLQRTELSYLELVDLLKTRFINPHQRSLILADKFLKNAELTNQEIRLLIQNNFVSSTPKIEAKLIKAEITLAQIQALIEPLRSTVIVLYAEKSECELDKTLIQYLDGSPLTEMDTWKLQRFIRLWRKLGWTMAELDSVLFSFGYSDTIPAEALQKLSQIQQLQIQLNLTLPKLLSFWGNLETQGEKSLYKILFQNKAVFNPPDPHFLLNDAQNELVDASRDPENRQHLADKQPALLAALRLKSSELEAIIANAQLTDPHLNLANLSAVYRYAALAKALRIPVQDLIALKKLAGVALDPFTPGDPVPTLKFIHLIQTIQSSGFVVPQLDYLFRHNVILPSKFPPQQPSVSALLKTLQDGLKAIAQDNQLLPVPESELTRNQLGTVFSSDFVNEIMQLIEGTAIYTVSLNELPLEVNFPESIQQKIRYERKALLFIGAMLDTERDLLLTLSPVDAYQVAINQLYQKPRTFLSQRDGINDESPSLADFWDLGTAETELLNKASLNSNEEPILVDLAGNVTNAETAVKTSIMAKFGYLLEKFLPYRQDILSRSFIQQTLSQALNLEDEILKHLLTNPKILQANAGADQTVLIDFLSLENLPTDPVWPDDTLASYERLHKIAILVNILDFSAKEVEYWFSSDFRGFLLNNFPITAIAEPTLFEEWQQLADYVILRDSLPPGVSNLIDVFKAEDDQKSDRLANLTNWGKENIENAIAGLGYQNSDLSSIPHLLKIQQIIALSKKIGVSIDKLRNWAIPAPNSEQAKEIKNAVKAKYNEAAWLEISKPLSDKLREKQKSALIAYVLSMPQIRAANVTDSNRLFEYFLIDVEMCACMNTSRIKQAISSVQLFVQRCLLNLEPAVSPRAIDSDRWQWTKNYRVWEANRKVFLYPENWIEPELRDDKSPFFKELESELLQTDVTNEAAEKALLNYLYKLDQVARLEVCGMYLQEETDGQDKSILHVFARTTGGAVRSYFYRRLLNNKEWTPWEKVELDINGVQGLDEKDFPKHDQEDLQGINLLPVVWNRRLYLFWLTLTKKERTNDNENLKRELGKEIKVNIKYWEIQLAWSIYDQGKWTSKQICRDKYEYDSLPAPAKFKLKILTNKNTLELDVCRDTKTSHGKFCADLINKDFRWIPNKNPEDTFETIVIAGVPHFMGLKASGDTELALTLQLSENARLSNAFLKVLDKIRSFKYLPLNQYYQSPSTAPYFLQDRQHVYFVRSREDYESIVKQLANPQKTSPFVEKELAPSFQRHLPLPKVDGRLEKSVANPWVLAEQQLVAQKLTTTATRSGSTFNP